MSVAIVVPVKAPTRAKHRLDSVLNQAERSRLARVMAAEVLAAVAAVRGCGRFAVSEDEAMLDLARGYGLEAIPDRQSGGQSAAVSQGFAAARSRGFTTGLTIPADVPGVTARDLEELLTTRADVDVLLVPDRGETGTNGLRLRLPPAIALRFGDDSLSLHRTEAERAGLRFAVHRVARLACDLDRPDDLRAFLELAQETATLDLLREMGLADRFAAAGRPPG